MDNGLIFPCSCRRVPGEPRCANRPNPGCLLREQLGGSAGPRLVVAKRWGDAGGQLRQLVVVLVQACRPVYRQIRTP